MEAAAVSRLGLGQKDILLKFTSCVCGGVKQGGAEGRIVGVPYQDSAIVDVVVHS